MNCLQQTQLPCHQEPDGDQAEEQEVKKVGRANAGIGDLAMGQMALPTPTGTTGFDLFFLLPIGFFGLS